MDGIGWIHGWDEIMDGWDGMMDGRMFGWDGMTHGMDGWLDGMACFFFVTFAGRLFISYFGLIHPSLACPLSESFFV